MPDFRNLSARLSLLSAALFLTACGSIPVEKREPMRNELIDRAEKSLAEFKDAYPEVASELETAEGFIIGWYEAGMLGPVRGLGGKAILYDKVNGTRTFLNVGKGGLGLGLGGNSFDQLFIFQEREPLEKFQRGRWFFDATAWSAAGETHRAAMPSGEGTRYMINRSGAALTSEVGLIRVSVNNDLTDNGVSEWFVPNTDFGESGRRRQDAPRVWPYRLPFLGQAVVDKGYDLPLPYGFGITAVNTQQDVEIQGLEIGFNGAPLQPYEFVSFADTNVDATSYQFKLDAWLFPFMNVFALYGKVSGDVASDVTLDGNTLLDQLGTDCSRLIPPIECLLFRDQNFVLPIRVDVDTTSYGFGTVFAGGWKGWFAVLPISSTYTRGRKSVTEGNSLTITPRIGRNFNIGNLGNMSVYVGGNRLDSDLTVTGVFDVPDTELSIGYKIDQQNVDRWNYVLGFNWNIGRHVNWGLEYNGFSGSRETWLTTINLRL